MKDTLFNIQNLKSKTQSNKNMIIFVVIDFVLLLTSIILGVFGMQDDPGRALASTHASLGIAAMIFLVVMVIASIFTFFYWISHVKHA